MTIPSEGDRNLFDNQEHQEARQNDVRQSDIEFFSKLGEKDLAKFYAIEQAMQLLTENGVHVQMLAFLKSIESPERNAPYYFQNIANFFEYENGKRTKESNLEASYYNHAFVNGFVNWFATYMVPTAKDPITIFQNMHTMCHYGNEWIKTGVPPPYITEQIS